MSTRPTQVKKLVEFDQLAAHLDTLGVQIPLVADVDPSGPLSEAVEIVDGSAGPMVSPNRFAVLPMEGWDGTDDGMPTDLVRRRWDRFASSGAGLVWAEATAVVPEGRANPHQLVLGPESALALGEMRSHMADVAGDGQLVGLQLTHSGRWCRPEGDLVPLTAYEHPDLDPPSGASAASVLSDDHLDELVARFVEAAALASEAGFDFVDVKACHGYLGHELLSAHGRPGRYGGDLEGRTRFLRSVIEGIRATTPELAIALRLSIFDLAPHVPGEDGRGRLAPSVTLPYTHAFGGDGTGVGIDLTETHAVLEMVAGLGVGLVSATAGSPYYVPHVQRPAYFPPSDGYLPPEDPLVGVARLIEATSELTRRHRSLTIIGSGFSYLQEWCAHAGEALLASGALHMIGLGRMALSYPHLPADVLAGRPLERGLLCRTFSDCTTAPRSGLVSGCFPLDPFYKGHPQRVELTAAKRATKERLGRA